MVVFLIQPLGIPGFPLNKFSVVLPLSVGKSWSHSWFLALKSPNRRKGLCKWATISARSSCLTSLFGEQHMLHMVIELGFNMVICHHFHSCIGNSWIYKLILPLPCVFSCYVAASFFIEVSWRFPISVLQKCSLDACYQDSLLLLFVSLLVWTVLPWRSTRIFCYLILSILSGGCYNTDITSFFFTFASRFDNHLLIY